MGLFRYPSTAQGDRIDERVDASVRKRREQHGDIERAERELIGDLLEYRHAGVEDITYDLYIARHYARLFPDPGYGERVGFLADLFRRAVRRVLRRQIVFNQAVLGVLEDLTARTRGAERGSSRDEPEEGEQ